MTHLEPVVYNRIIQYQVPPLSSHLKLAVGVADLLGHLADSSHLARIFGYLQVSLKADGTTVTTVDLGISETLERELRKIVDVPVVSEENITRLRSEFHELRHYWLVDPIDGTDDFIKNNPGYGICVALINDGQPVVGVVAAPHETINNIYLAAKGAGAYKRTIGSSELVRLHTRSSDLNAPQLDFATYFKFTNEEAAAQAKFLSDHKIKAELQKVGAIVKYTSLAEGRFDLAGGWKQIHTWDIAAADILISEAGGILINGFTGAKMRYDNLSDMRISSALALSARMVAAYGHKLIKPNQTAADWNNFHF